MSFHLTMDAPVTGWLDADRCCQTPLKPKHCVTLTPRHFHANAVTVSRRTQALLFTVLSVYIPVEAGAMDVQHGLSVSEMNARLKGNIILGFLAFLEWRHDPISAPSPKMEMLYLLDNCFSERLVLVLCANIQLLRSLIWWFDMTTHNF